MTKSDSEITINQEEIRIHSSKAIRFVFFIAGLLAVILGIAGIFLPLLPATIFFILAAWCFARSSENLYKWLHCNRFFGKYLKNYRKQKGMTVGSKVFTITLLWIGILYSVFFASTQIYIRILLFIIAAGVTIHLLTIRTIKNSD